MGLFKIAAAIFVIAAGLAGSILIIKDSGQTSEEKLAKEAKNQKGAEILSAGEKPIQWLTKKETGQKENYLKESAAVNSGDSDADSDNLTKIAARSIFSGMRRMDEENKNPTDYFNPSNPSTSNNKKAVEEALNNLKNPLSSLNVSINDGDLKISPDNSNESKINYLKSTAEIIMNNSNEFFNNPLKALDKMMYGDVSAINQVIYSYSEIYKELLNTPAPRDWLGLHKRYLEILKKTEIIYRGMADFQNDPIKAALFGDALPRIVETEVKIREEYSNKEKELRN